jgi:hypothetical protein
MKRLLVTSVIAGIIAGILAGGFYNFFQVPVIERAIALEEERAASVSPPGSADESGAEVSLGVQRIGMVISTTIYGAITGSFFAAGFVLLHRAAPSWPVVWVALSVGALGFWSLSLFPFIRYPVSPPPGVGGEATLVARQLGQVLLMLISAAAIGVALDAIRRIHQNFAEFAARRVWYAGVLGVYAILALVMVFVFPGYSDPVTVPIDLLELFRALTMAGQFLTWALLATGVTLALLWHQRSVAAQTASSSAPARIAQ